MATLKRVSPIVPEADVLKSVEFFETVLGFESIVKSASYALIQRDNVNLHLQLTMENAGQIACYIDVEGVDSLYEELKPQLSKLPSGRVRAPFNQGYGKREFHVMDIDSQLIFW